MEVGREETTGAEELTDRVVRCGWYDYTRQKWSGKSDLVLFKVKNSLHDLSLLSTHMKGLKLFWTQYVWQDWLHVLF